jgi:hypothetical protein
MGIARIEDVETVGRPGDGVPGNTHVPKVEEDCNGQVDPESQKKYNPSFADESARRTGLVAASGRARIGKLDDLRSLGRRLTETLAFLFSNQG